MKVSMTTFVDFVIARGSSRITRIKSAKEQYSQDYSPARDFYKQIREGIIDVHYTGQPLASLDAIASHATARKQDLYKECVTGYKKWHGKKNIAAFPVDNDLWSYGKLEVNINPELGLSVNGADYLVKLYFKKGSPSQPLLQAALYLLSLHPICASGTATPAILEVQAGKLKTQKVSPPGLSALLAGDAIAFATMWDKL